MENCEAKINDKRSLNQCQVRAYTQLQYGLFIASNKGWVRWHEVQWQGPINYAAMFFSLIKCKIYPISFLLSSYISVFNEIFISLILNVGSILNLQAGYWIFNGPLM